MDLLEVLNHRRFGELLEAFSRLEAILVDDRIPRVVACKLKCELSVFLSFSSILLLIVLFNVDDLLNVLIIAVEPTRRRSIRLNLS